jgi:hypothetical protein
MSNSMAPKYGSGNCQSFCATAIGPAITHAASVAIATNRRMERFLLNACGVPACWDCGGRTLSADHQDGDGNHGRPDTHRQRDEGL